MHWDPNQYQLENELRKRLREEQARTSTQSSTGNLHHVQTLPPLLTGAFNFETERNDERPQKRLKETAASAARTVEQAVAPVWQETNAYATNNVSHMQIPVSLTSTSQPWNKVSGDHGTYDYSQGLAVAETTTGAHYHGPYNPIPNLASCYGTSSDQYPTTYETPIIPSAAQVSTFQGAHNPIVGGHARIMTIGTISNVNNYSQFGLDILERYMEKYVSLNAVHDSPVQDPDRKCHPETRRNVLKQIRDWIDDPDGNESIFWLHGPAGAGKSAIAQTIACSSNKVAATFFFYRSDSSRNDGNKLFTTIAWQLALLIPEIKNHIINSLNERPDLPRKGVETQFQELIVKPLQALTEASSQTQSSPLVVIVDGVDECVDEKLQRRFLAVIGNAVNDCDFPLRFLICSRPEVHIEDAIDKFEFAPLRLNLAKLDDANRDIETYIRAEFSRIASEQDLDPTWPGDRKIWDIVYKSSGHFIYASTVIKIVDDDNSSATTQLDIVLGLKPPGSKSPFAELDSLYMEILKRQQDWDFLNNMLSLLITKGLFRTKGCAILMNIPENEMRRKLRGMRSLVQSDPYIQNHQSFLDFLKDPSRSGQYHISQPTAEKRYLDLLTASIIRRVPTVLEQPDCLQRHFFPRIYLEEFTLSIEARQEALQPLVHIQDKLLSLEKSSWQRLLRCKKCNIVSTVRDLLLYLTCYRGMSKNEAAHPVQAVEQGLAEQAGAFGSLTPFVAEQTVLEKSDLDVCLSSVLVHLRKTKLEFLSCAMMTDLMLSLLNFDHVETAIRVRSISDAQVLVDMIDYLINNENFLKRHSTVIARRIALLALEIYARVPVFPRSMFCPGDLSQRFISDFWSFDSVFLARILDRNYVHRLSWISKTGIDFRGVYESVNEDNESLKIWRSRSNPSLVMMMQVMLDLAKVIQYVDSVGVLLDHPFGLRNIYLDSECHVKIFPLGSIPPWAQSDDDELAYPGNAFILGQTFYELCFNSYVSPTQLQDLKRPSEPEISEEVWRVIQRCYTLDPKSRPTVDEVVQEMESWKLN